MPKKLQYFNVNALAEPIRYILHYTKQEFEDIRHDFASWPDPKIKESLPYHQFPIYEEDGRILTQSLAITKYVARDSDLIPADPWLQAVVECAAYNISDYWANVRNWILEKDLEKKKPMKKKILEETIDFYFSRFEKELSDNGGYFIGKLSWAEFMLCGMVESTNLFMGIQLEKKYPAVEAAVENVRNLPGVKEHIAARGPYDLKVLKVQL